MSYLRKEDPLGYNIEYNVPRYQRMDLFNRATATPARARMTIDFAPEAVPVAQPAPRGSIYSRFPEWGYETSQNKGNLVSLGSLSSKRYGSLGSAGYGSLGLPPSIDVQTAQARGTVPGTSGKLQESYTDSAIQRESQLQSGLTRTDIENIIFLVTRTPLKMAEDLPEGWRERARICIQKTSDNFRAFPTSYFKPGQTTQAAKAEAQTQFSANMKELVRQIAKLKELVDDLPCNNAKGVILNGPVVPVITNKLQTIVCNLPSEDFVKETIFFECELPSILCKDKADPQLYSDARTLIKKELAKIFSTTDDFIKFRGPFDINFAKNLANQLKPQVCPAGSGIGKMTLIAGILAAAGGAAYYYFT